MNDQEEERETRPNLAENTTLQELGYNFTITAWPDFHALISKAQHDLSAALDLLQSLVHRADLLRQQHGIAEHDPSSQRFLIDGFLTSARAVAERAAVFRQVYDATCEQFAMVLQAGADDDEDVSAVDSLFDPGQKIEFRHLQAQMVEFVYGFTEFFAVREALEDKSEVLEVLDLFWHRGNGEEGLH
ncbi:MAG: hypothetical protein Q9207_003072 [Kuettlingeria erythrocarpa]